MATYGVTRRAQIPDIEKHCPEFAADHPELPLSAACQMRNAVAHGCFEVDFELVWKTISRELSGLYVQIRDAQANVRNQNT